MSITKFLIALSVAVVAVGLHAQAQNCGCSSDLCCSQFGYCGSGDDYCGTGCQSGPCYTSTATGTSISDILAYFRDSPMTDLGTLTSGKLRLSSLTSRTKLDSFPKGPSCRCFPHLELGSPSVLLRIISSSSRRQKQRSSWRQIPILLHRFSFNSAAASSPPHAWCSSSSSIQNLHCSSFNLQQLHRHLSSCSSSEFQWSPPPALPSVPPLATAPSTSCLTFTRSSKSSFARSHGNERNRCSVRKSSSFSRVTDALLRLSSLQSSSFDPTASLANVQGSSSFLPVQPTSD